MTLRPIGDDDFRQLFLRHPVPTWVCDALTQAVLDVNDAAVRTYGYSRDEFLRLTLSNLVAEAQGRTEDHGIGTRHRLKDGRVIDVHVRSCEVTIGGRSAMVWTVEELHTDLALRESEARFVVAFRKAAFSSVISDRESGAIVEVNEAFERLFGYTQQEVFGRTSTDLGIYPAETRQQLGAAFNAQGFVRDAEVTVTTKQGEPRLVLLNSDPVDIAGRKYVISTAQDISHRKATEGALREALDRERQAVRAGNVGLWDWDLRSNRVHYSPEWKRQIGYADDEMSDDFSEWQTRVHPDDLDRCLETARRFVTSPWPNYELEFRFRHKDGSYRHILAHASLVRDEHGQPIRMLGSHVDVTERAELEARLLQAQKMESVGRLAGGVAHDFNNLLTVINGTAELAMLKLRESDPLREDLLAIQQAGNRGAQLTRQLLAFSRKQVLQPALLDLNAVISGMETMLRRLIGEDVTLVFTPTPDLWCVKADPGQLEQVLLNLAVNARDAMPHGGTMTIATANVELGGAHSDLRPPVAAGSYVRISVTDTGIGMDDMTQGRLFEPFFTTKGAGKGTGLGLSTVYGIVSQSGGSVGVTSEVGRGTSFHLHLPRVDAEALAGRSAQVGKAERGTETILIVDDDDALRRLAERALGSAGYKVLSAANGAEALQLLERVGGAVHMVLTDVVMPGMSGPELAERIRATRGDIPVLFSSGYTDDAILHHGVLNDLAYFISKPYSVAALTRKVRDVLDRRG